jgi:hypothetical protein
MNPLYRPMEKHKSQLFSFGFPGGFAINYPKKPTLVKRGRLGRVERAFMVARVAC